MSLVPASYAFIKTLLKGNALTVFQNSKASNGNQTMTNFESCLNELTAHLFPEKAAQLQKRYLRRYLTKSPELTIKRWVAQVLELNYYLKKFPAVNGVREQPVNDAEVMEILEYSVPSAYRR